MSVISTPELKLTKFPYMHNNIIISYYYQRQLSSPFTARMIWDCLNLVTSSIGIITAPCRNKNQFQSISFTPYTE